MSSDCSIPAMSSKPPSRLAMSPDGNGSPSSAVTMPTTSCGPTGAITTTWSCSGVSPNVSGRSTPPEPRTAPTRSGDTGSPYTFREVITMKATGCIGSNVPGGSTRRCTPFCPPAEMKPSRSAKFPNSGL